MPKVTSENSGLISSDDEEMASEINRPLQQYDFTTFNLPRAYRYIREISYVEPFSYRLRDIHDYDEWRMHLRDYFSRMKLGLGDAVKHIESGLVLQNTMHPSVEHYYEEARGDMPQLKKVLRRIERHMCNVVRKTVDNNFLDLCGLLNCDVSYVTIISSIDDFAKRYWVERKVRELRSFNDRVHLNLNRPRETWLHYRVYAHDWIVLCLCLSIDIKKYSDGQLGFVFENIEKAGLRESFKKAGKHRRDLGGGTFTDAQVSVLIRITQLTKEVCEEFDPPRQHPRGKKKGHH